MDYKKTSVSELRVIAFEKGIKNVNSIKKKELIEMLEALDNSGNDAEKSVNTPAEKTTTVHKRRPVSAEKVNADEADSAEQNVKTASAEVKSADNNGAAVKRRPASSRSASGKAVSERVASEKAASERINSEKTTTDKTASGRRNFSKNTSGISKNVSADGKNTSADSKNASVDSKNTSADGKNTSSESSYEPKFRYENISSGVNVDPSDEKPEYDEPKRAYPEEGGYFAQKEVPQEGNEPYYSSVADDYAEGIVEVLPDGFGFIRSDNYMPGTRDLYISPAQIRRCKLRTGDILRGPARRKLNKNENYGALLRVDTINGYTLKEIENRAKFEDMTPIFPNERIHLDYTDAPVSLRIVDLFSPIGKGQRGMIVSPPKAGKTTLLKQIAKRISVSYPEITLLVLLIDERPEEVTDIKESIAGPNVEVIYSTFDELPEHHKRVSEMVLERAKRMVESGNDVVILIDSITRLSRAYNLTVTPSGRTLSGGLDPAALHMPKKFFGAARNMREGGSLTILATALIETGSRLDDVVFEEFKGTGNMELVLNRNLSEKRVFPAIDIAKSGTRRDDLLLSQDERDVLDIIHKSFRNMKNDDVTEEVIKLLKNTRDNQEFLEIARKTFLK